MTTKELRALARMGAQIRLAEIDAQIVKIQTLLRNLDPENDVKRRKRTARSPERRKRTAAFRESRGTSRGVPLTEAMRQYLRLAARGQANRKHIDEALNSQLLGRTDGARRARYWAQDPLLEWD
jgi:hypothetical protein